MVDLLGQRSEQGRLLQLAVLAAADDAAGRPRAIRRLPAAARLVGHQGQGGPAALAAEQKPALKEALAAAAHTHSPAAALDWMDTAVPEHWRLYGKNVRYNWYEEG